MIGVYANPNDGVFKVALAFEEIGRVTIKVMGLTGNILVEKQFEKSDQVVELPIEEELVPGIYTMQIIVGNKSSYEKLVVE